MLYGTIYIKGLGQANLETENTLVVAEGKVGMELGATADGYGVSFFSRW